MPHTEVVNFVADATLIIDSKGFRSRLGLGLGPKEVASLLGVTYFLGSTTITQYAQALSLDPLEDENLADTETCMDKNIIASRFVMSALFTGVGVIFQQSQYFPIPDGIDVASDISYMIGVANDATVMHGCSVYFQRRKEKPGEREALIMSRR